MGSVDDALGWTTAIGLAQGWFSPPGGNPPELEPVQPWLLGIAEGGDLMATLAMKLEHEHCIAWGVVDEGSTDMGAVNAKLLMQMKEAEGKPQVDWADLKLQARRGRQLWADTDLSKPEDLEEEVPPEVLAPRARRACDQAPRPEGKTTTRPTAPRPERVHSKSTAAKETKKRGRQPTQDEIAGTDSEVDMLTAGRDKHKRSKHAGAGEEKKRGSTLGARLRAITAKDM
jgi:hypothetical protein